MLKKDKFKKVIEFVPLVSIDLCLIFQESILLGLRKNEPLKNNWFTPGGRILKNEPWDKCISRIASLELGLREYHPRDFKLMGIWDHFYENSLVSKNISTHYVNLPHYLKLHEKPKLKKDSQHSKLEWFKLKEICESNCFHQYVKNYASWLLKADIISS